MCRSCDETPDSLPRRCNRPDGFSAAEGDSRTVARNLTTANDALVGGDPQRAADSLARAAAAQQRLSGLAGQSRLPGGGEDRSIYVDTPVASTDVEHVTVALGIENQARVARGEAPLSWEVHQHQYPVAGDPLKAWEQSVVRVFGPQASTALSRVAVYRGVGNQAVKVVSAEQVIAAALVSQRLTGGYVVRGMGPVSTAENVAAYVNAEPGSPARAALTPSAEDVQEARRIIGWLRMAPVTSDFQTTVRSLVGRGFVPTRSVGTAAASVVLYNRHLREVAVAEQARHLRAQAARDAVQRGVSGGTVPPDESARSRNSGHTGATVKTLRHLGKRGDVVTTRAKVVKVKEVYHRSRREARFLYVMEDPDGNSIRWLATKTAGMREGDPVTISGTVKELSEFAGKPETVMHYCKVRIHAPY